MTKRIPFRAMPPLPSLRLYRVNAALTQAELAELASVSRPTISRLERGESASIRTMRKLANPLLCLPVDLMAQLPALPHK